jgi:hypothetical protein
VMRNCAVCPVVEIPEPLVDRAAAGAEAVAISQYTFRL